MKRILDKRKITDWQEYRTSQKGIGGSEVATILGLNPYQSKFTLWLEKTGQKVRDEVNNEFVEWGNLLEPVVRDKFKKDTGFKVYQNNFVLQHDKHEFMLANIDGEVIDPAFSGRGILEIKTTSEWNKKNWENGMVPINYMAQMQHYLAVTGYEYGYIAVLIGGNKYKHWLVERDDHLIDQIIQMEYEFDEMCNKMIAPEIGGSQIETDWLSATFPDAVDEEMSIPHSIEELALEYNEIQDEIKEKTVRANEIKNTIKLQAKEYKTLKGNLVTINLPTINKILFDSKRFQIEHPDLYTEYKTKESSYRDFRIKLLEAK